MPVGAGHVGASGSLAVVSYGAIALVLARRADARRMLPAIGVVAAGAGGAPVVLCSAGRRLIRQRDRPQWRTVSGYLEDLARLVAGRRLTQNAGPPAGTGRHRSGAPRPDQVLRQFLRGGRPGARPAAREEAAGANREQRPAAHARAGEGSSAAAAARAVARGMSEWTLTIEAVIAPEPTPGEMARLSDQLSGYCPSFRLLGNRIWTRFTVLAPGRSAAGRSGVRLLQRQLSALGLGFDPVTIQVLAAAEQSVVAVSPPVVAGPDAGAPRAPDTAAAAAPDAAVETVRDAAGEAASDLPAGEALSAADPAEVAEPPDWAVTYWVALSKREPLEAVVVDMRGFVRDEIFAEQVLPSDAES
jgi:hypothetical protein